MFNNLNSIGLAATAINPAGSTITIPAGDPMTTFTQGEVYFLTSSAGGTFCTITSINAGARQLSFVASDILRPQSAGGCRAHLGHLGRSHTGHISPANEDHSVLRYFNWTTDAPGFWRSGIRIP